MILRSTKCILSPKTPKAKNGRIICGGTPHPAGDLFYTPTIIADATDDMRFATEEIFGPIAPLFRFHDEAEVIARANNTAYGLAAYVYTKDMGRTWRSLPNALNTVSSA